MKMIVGTDVPEHCPVSGLGPAQLRQVLKKTPFSRNILKIIILAIIFSETKANKNTVSSVNFVDSKQLKERSIYVMRCAGSLCGPMR
jgi:hypothetical protein